ncbi:CotY/CotZ family spore coat protein [Bacillus sp. JJ664]
MSCKDNNHHKKNNDNNCVSDVVKFINELQDCATNTCPTGCDVPFLGANPNVPLANTRPFLLFLPNGELFRVPAFLNNMRDRDRNDNRNDDNDKNDKNRRNNCQDSVVFRVESVDDDCAVLRALVGADRDDDKNNSNKDRDRQDFCDLVDADFFVASNTCITVDLDAFIAIQCLRDVHVNNL